MKKIFAGSLIAVLLASSSGAESPKPASLSGQEINRAATNASSLFLDAGSRARVASTFLKLVQIKGVSGQEQDIRAEVRRLAVQAGAHELPVKAVTTNAPLNLLLEIPASRGFSNRPGILLNAHLDTIAASTPEQTLFDAATGDFFHAQESTPGKISSFGGDDRSGIIVVLEAVRELQARYWSRVVPHRRIVLLFTADEERGCVGAKYLAAHQPELFANLDVTLSVDGPLDLKTAYPKESLVTVVSEADSTRLPYKHVLELTKDFCERTKLKSLKTEVGLGFGDFAFFPPAAKSGLHIRSPVRGWHTQERVKVQDLINHVDLLCFLLLGWDNPLLAKIPPETVVPPK